MPSHSSVYDTLGPYELDLTRSLGGRIRFARQRRNWTQEILSEKTGISVGTIKNMERGSPRVPFAFWLKALDAFGRGHEIDSLLMPENDLIGAASDPIDSRQRVRQRTASYAGFEFPQ